MMPCLSCSQDLARVAVRVAPGGLAHVDGQLVLLVADAAVRAALQQQVDNLHVPAHGCPVQRCVLPLSFTRMAFGEAPDASSAPLSMRHWHRLWHSCQGKGPSGRAHQVNCIDIRLL